MEKLKKIGRVLGRSEMKKIMAGSGSDQCSGSWGHDPNCPGSGTNAITCNQHCQCDTVCKTYDMSIDPGQWCRESCRVA
jgi:hypothetical protein